MYPVFQIGGASIQTPGLALLVGVWIALDIFSREAGRRTQNAEHAYNAGFYALIGGLIAARLSFVALHIESYLDSPLSIFSILPGSALPNVGFIAGIIVWFVFLKRKEALNLEMLDAVAPALAILAAAVAAANFLSGDGYGLETSLPWAIDLWSAKRHPTQIYELLAALAVFGFLWRYRTRWPFDGAALLAWVIGYGSVRLVLEAFRADSWLLPGNLRGIQVISLLAILAAMLLLARRAPKSRAV